MGIQDVQLSLTPLEEVFLNVARQAELEYASAEGKFEMLLIPEENCTVKVCLPTLSLKIPQVQKSIYSMINYIIILIIVFLKLDIFYELVYLITGLWASQMKYVCFRFDVS